MTHGVINKTFIITIIHDTTIGAHCRYDRGDPDVTGVVLMLPMRFRCDSEIVLLYLC